MRLSECDRHFHCPELKAAVPNVGVGIVTAAVKVTQHDDRLWRKIQANVD